MIIFLMLLKKEDMNNSQESYKELILDLSVQLRNKPAMQDELSQVL